MKIPFIGEGADGGSITYESWRELAETMPLHPIPPESLCPEQTEYLIGEFEKMLAGSVKEGDKPPKDGHVPVPAGEHLRAPKRRNKKTKIERHIDFATINLPTLKQSDVASFEQSVALALKYLRLEIGDFERFDRTFVERVGGKWRVVTLLSAAQNPIPTDDGRERKVGTPCEQLHSLCDYGIEDAYTGVWHAVRLLNHAQRARDAVKHGDFQAALDASVIVGDSHRALRVKIAAATDGGSSGYDRNESNSGDLRDDRKKWLRKQAIELCENHPGKYKGNVDAVAKALIPRLKEKVREKVEWNAVGLSAIKTDLKGLII